MRRRGSIVAASPSSSPPATASESMVADEVWPMTSDDERLEEMESWRRTRALIFWLEAEEAYHMHVGRS